MGPAGREEAETILCLGGRGEKSPGVPFQNPGFEGRHGWVWGIKSGDNCTLRSGVGVTHPEWISVDAEATLGPVHSAGSDCFCTSPCCGVSRAALLSSAELRSPTPWCARQDWQQCLPDLKDCDIRVGCSSDLRLCLLHQSKWEAAQ